MFVNSEKVLGFSHADIVQLFQAIPVGASTDLVLSKYYLLPPELAQPTAAAASAAAAPAANSSSRHSHALAPQLVFTALPDPLLVPSHSLTASQPQPQAQQQQQQQAPPATANGNGVSATGRLTPSIPDLVAASATATDGPQQPLDMRAFQQLEVRLVKGSSGFGFTVARNSRAVHYVHHISAENAAPEQLAGLQLIRVGDIIYEVEGSNVLYASHAEVVALFKSFRPHSTVAISVLRPRLPNEPLRSQSTGARLASGH